MATFLLIIHLIVSFFLITIVLIQGGKGAELGAAFGGSSQTLFGARGAATFFSKLTTGAAIVFMLTSFSLAIVTSKGGSIVIKKAPAATEQRQSPPQGATGPVQGVPPSTPAQQAPAAPVSPAR
ncbi:MAG: preprotein translocase subunit SecG [Nitrospira bacterium HGW-Nitrospira-1]|nr:MAG: preprotein translocase subunit SecG [Nitrospira bacterium HGW-Nitrospira-1]